MRTILFMLCGVGAFAAEADMLPATAKATCEKMDKALNEIRAKVIVELNRQMIECEKKNDLVGADAIAGKIAELKALIDAAKPQVPNALGIPPLLLGKWKVSTSKYNSVWEFKADGTVKRENGEGKFVIEGTTVTITWLSNGFKETMDLPTKTTTTGRSTGGDVFKFEKR